MEVALQYTLVKTLSVAQYWFNGGRQDTIQHDWKTVDWDVKTGPRSTVGNVSGNRCESDCRSRGR